MIYIKVYNYALGLYERAARDLSRRLCRLSRPLLRTPLEPLRLRASLIAHSVCGVRGVRRVLRTHDVARRVLLRARGVLARRVLRALRALRGVWPRLGVLCYDKNIPSV